MKVKIEEYRGFNILFETESELFECELTATSHDKGSSLVSVKKQIDDYLNVSFTPFFVINKRFHEVHYKKARIIGKEKNGCFVIEERGTRSVMTSYGHVSYFIWKEKEGDRLIKKIEAINAKINKLNKERQELLESCKLDTLDYGKDCDVKK
jgi:hypothetical protein